jgi:hypothetical protein
MRHESRVAVLNMLNSITRENVKMNNGTQSDKNDKKSIHTVSSSAKDAVKLRFEIETPSDTTRILPANIYHDTMASISCISESAYKKLRSIDSGFVARKGRSLRIGTGN